ncbi:hypothetical protein EDC96DRAFT_547022 [Choanephora cucurbitarum]|nr:hypothetical protein EDC96DRAFT_547022 [Choanephora cucurbitarum]
MSVKRRKASVYQKVFILPRESQWFSIVLNSSLCEITNMSPTTMAMIIIKQVVHTLFRVQSIVVSLSFCVASLQSNLLPRHSSFAFVPYSPFDTQISAFVLSNLEKPK